MKKVKVFSDAKKLLGESYPSSLADDILNNAYLIYDEILECNKDENKAVKVHTVSKIYPSVSLYRAMQKCGIDKDEALQFLDRLHTVKAEGDAKSIKAMLKIPFVYKLYPAIYAKVAQKQFGEKQGFKAKFYSKGGGRVKFDMTKCLYCYVCKKCGCPEIVPCFCHEDDVCAIGIHKNLKWNRTQTMGEGAEFCDFDLYVDKK